MNDCIFCKIVAKEIPSQIVYEDEATIAFLDHTPVNPGHVLVLPKEHARNIFDISKESWASTMETVRRITPAIQNATGATGININVNNEPAAGQVVFHSHIHIIPRFENDGHALWHGKEMGAEESEKMAAKITAAL